MKPSVRRAAGFTLVEIIVALGIFAVISGMMYGIFTAVKGQVAVTSTTNALSEKGQRILSYLEEDIRMLGFLLGPDARVPYCTTDGLVPNNPNIIVHNGHTLSDGATNNATAYDSFQFLTSRPVPLSETSACFNGQAGLGGTSDTFLTTTTDAPETSVTVNVDAIKSCYDDIVLGDTPAENGRSLVTFDSLLLAAAPLQSSASLLYYRVTGMVGSTVTLDPPLQQTVPRLSTVYLVYQYRYSVVTASGSRDLVRTQWDKSCGTDTFPLIEATGTKNRAGGVDGFKIEFIFLDTITNSLITLSSLPPLGQPPLTQLKAIVVWLLLRSDRSDPGHKDTATYTLGTTADKVVVGPFNDEYHRVLLNKTIEVKNLVSIT